MEDNKAKAFVLTIDGPAGAGKSTIAKIVASKLGVSYLDTGAIYRSITLFLTRRGIETTEDEKIMAAMGEFDLSMREGRVFVNGEDVTLAIRTPEIDKAVSPYAALRLVRESLLSLQRKQAENGIVADGRDMGTVVFPDADLKIFLTASPEERAKRRYDERIARGEEADYDEILRQVNERDHYDMNREIAPLRPAQGCVILDSTTMTIDEVAESITALAAELRGKN